MHAVLLGGSVLLAVIQVASTWLLTRKSRLGWTLSFAANVIGIVYDALTFQYGFIPVSGVNLWLAASAWRKWGKEA